MLSKNTILTGAYKSERCIKSKLESEIEYTIRRFKCILIVQGVSQASIARQLGVTRSSVNRIILGKARSRRIERALLDYGIDISDLQAPLGGRLS